MGKEGILIQIAGRSIEVLIDGMQIKMLGGSHTTINGGLRSALRSICRPRPASDKHSFLPIRLKTRVVCVRLHEKGNSKALMMSRLIKSTHSEGRIRAKLSSCQHG